MRAVDIRGTNSINKGAQLMLDAVVERLGGCFELSAPPTLTAYPVRAEHQLRQTLQIRRWPRASSAAGNVLPRKLRRDFGLVAEAEIGGVVDASGFAYSDSFSVERVRGEALCGRRWVKRRVPKVLLPQAFGPFQNPEIRRWSSEVLDQSTLIFSRDRVSTSYLAELGFTKNVLEFPDFTVGLSGTPIGPIHEREFLAIVPNARMVSDAGIELQLYVAQLAAYANAAASQGLDTVVVVHQEGDRSIAEALAKLTGAIVYEHAQPRVLKSALGQATAIVSSRFHAVAGGLSQGVPTLAFGWSHKYVELLNDFRVPAWNVSLGDDAAVRLAQLLQDGAGQQRLDESRLELVSKVDTMWRLVIDALQQ